MKLLVKILGWLDLPPVWLVAFGAAIWAWAKLTPFAPMQRPGVTEGGVALIAVALILMVWAAVEFRRHRTTLIPGEEPSALVTGGPYRFSRNPIYLADALILVGWCLTQGALIPMVLVPVFMWVIERRFILPEEDRLRAAFGEGFTEWASRVRRWY